MKNSFILFLFCVFISFINAQNVNPSTAFLKHKDTYFENASKFFKTNSVQTPRFFDALYYKLQLDIDLVGENIDGSVTGRYKSQVNNLDRIDLDFDDALSISSIHGPVKSYIHSGQTLEIELNRAFSINEIIEITVNYQGRPNPTDSRYFEFDVTDDGSPHVWTLSEPYSARYWWPCKDTPADKADSVDIIITVPARYEVASNGTLRSITEDNGLSTWHWHSSYPITTYLVSLAIAEYSHFQDNYILPDGKEMLLDYYVYPSREAIARSYFPGLKDQLDAMIHYFGPYPFEKEKYGLAQFRWGGGMEHQTISSVGQITPAWEYIYLHELAHQWFGDAITCASWQDIWLNEGFASYSEALYAEWAGYGGYPPGQHAYREYIKTQAFTSDGTITVTDTSTIRNIFGRIVYDKGSYVLHMLRGVLGDAIFFKAIKEYISDPQLRYSSVRTSDFVNVVEMVSGKSMQRFFDQWLNYPFYPIYNFEWSALRNGAQTQVDLTIIQKQNSIIYEMPLDIQFIFSSNLDSVIRVENNSKVQTYRFNFNESPERINLDPDDWVLKDVRDASKGTFTNKVRIQNVYPNPFNGELNIEVKSWDLQPVTLNIFNLQGQLINTLSPYRSNDFHEYFFKWQGLNLANQSVSAGIYLVRAKRGKNLGETFKVVFIK